MTRGIGYLVASALLWPLDLYFLAGLPWWVVAVMGGGWAAFLATAAIAFR